VPRRAQVGAGERWRDGLGRQDSTAAANFTVTAIFEHNPGAGVPRALLSRYVARGEWLVYPRFTGRRCDALDHAGCLGPWTKGDRVLS
jgi:hypothetical protein